MHWNRRTFMTVSTAALAGAATVPGWLAALAAESGLRPLRRNVGIFTARGGTIGWLASPAGVAVIDTQFPESAATCRSSLEEQAEHGVDLVLNTHHHGDHTAGNAVFAAAGATLVAQRNVPRLQRAAAERGDKDPAAETVAGELFDTTWRREIGDEVLSAKHYGPGHTGGDAVIHLEQADVVHVGDLVFNRWHPFIDKQGGESSIEGWIGVLEAVVREHPDDSTVFVFGHGSAAAGVTGTQADLLLQRDYLTAVWERAAAGRTKGLDADALAAAGPLAGFEGYESMGDALSLRASLAAALIEMGGK